MASINGLELKGVKYFPDHEGAMIPYGNLYFNGKKVGSFRFDSWGGPMHYDHTHKTITQEEVSEVLHGIVKKFGWHEFYDTTDILIEELLELKEIESNFKKAQKQGKILMVIREDRYLKPFQDGKFVLTTSYLVSENVTDKDVERLTKEIIEENGGKGAVSVYRTLDDFIQ